MATGHGVYGPGATVPLWQHCIRVPHHVPLTALPFCSSTSTLWLPPSSRRCFRQILLPAPPFTSCSMTSSLRLATSLPDYPSPVSPLHLGFPLLPAVWTPATGSLSQSSIKVKQQTPRESLGFSCGDGWPPEPRRAVGPAPVLESTVPAPPQDKMPCCPWVGPSGKDRL